MNAADGGIAQQSISRKYLHDEVAGRLRALIQAGELKPQERLNEGRLAARFGISRTPLREAIKILATEGLLDLLPNRGARVAIISNSEIEEMAEVIAGLEATAGELACRVGTDAEIAQILDLHEHMKQAYKAEDAPQYFDYNRQIHEAIMAASHNNTLQSIYATLSGRVQRARYAAHKTPGQWKKAMADHEQMVKLLRKRDGEALGRLLREHVRSKKAVIAATFRED